MLEDAGARLRDPNITETWEEFWQEFRRLQVIPGPNMLLILAMQRFLSLPVACELLSISCGISLKAFL